jgi:FkbM family methyltransferase
MRLIRKYTYYFASILRLLTGFKNPTLILSIFLGKKAVGSQTVQLRHGPAFRVRGAMDVWSIKETFLNRFYERCGFIIQPGWTVIDVGAGLGDFTLFAAQIKGTSVFAYEPFPDSVKLLNENVALNMMENIHVSAEAVSSAQGSLLLDLAGGEPLQIQSHNAPVTQPDHQISVKARSLTEILDSLGESPCNLLKLDCEGAEYDILMKSPPETLAKIERIVMETHDGVTEFSHHDLAEYLKASGFKVQTFANPVHGNLGYLRASR